MYNSKFSLFRRDLGVKLITVLFLTVNFTSFSQEETFNREVQVVREYNPAISDAFKINDMPSTNDTLKANPVFRYQLKGKALITPPEMVPITPARLANEPLDELFPAYIQGFVGNYDIFGGKFLYNLVRNEKFALALNVAHESSLGDIKLNNKEEVNADYHETVAGLYMRHFFKKATFSVNMDFINFAYRYYGKQNIKPDIFYSFPSDSLPGIDILKKSAQRQTGFDMNMRLKNRVLKNNTLYDILLGFYTFENHSGIVENSFRYGGNFTFVLKDFELNFETSVDYAGSRIDKVSTSYPLQVYNFENRDRTLLQLNPALIRRHDNFMIKLGLRIGAGFDTIEDEFYLSPDVGVNFKIENTVVIQAGITGEIKPYSYRNIMAENPFITPDLNVETGFHGAKFYAGINGNFSNKTSFGFRVEYGTFVNEHFFINKLYTSNDTLYYGNRFGVQYDDGRLLSVSGEFKANINSNFDLILRAAHYGWKTDSLDKAWHKPSMELGIRTIYKATRDLNFSAAFNILGERYYILSLPKVIENEGQAQVVWNTKRIKPVYDFNLGANYTLNSRWNFFCTIQNIFISKCYMYYGYPMHGINMKVGAGFSF